MFLEIIIKKTIDLISPDLRKGIETLIRDLYVRAKNTDNQFDDYLIIIIAAILQIKIDD